MTDSEIRTKYAQVQTLIKFFPSRVFHIQQTPDGYNSKNFLFLIKLTTKKDGSAKKLNINFLTHIPLSPNLSVYKKVMKNCTYFKQYSHNLVSPKVTFLE